VLGERDLTIRQLELKLNTAYDQRKRAESRWGAALKQNAKMLSELAAMAAQVQPEASPSLTRARASILYRWIPRLFVLDL